MSQVTRDFTVATFVVDRGQILLLWHRKLQMWLPPGGHIEPNELPDEAAVREVREETGIDAELMGEDGLAVGQPKQLIRPAGIQLEPISPGHEHIDLIYFARPRAGAPLNIIGNDESEKAGWFTLNQLRQLGAPEDVLLWSKRAIAAVGQ